MPDPKPTLKIFVGFSADEMIESNVAEQSFRMKARTVRPDVRRISRFTLGDAYVRETGYLDGQRWDVISNAPMSTDHAIARFFVPWLCDYQGWALFTDGDVLCRTDIGELFAQRDEKYAVMCVQHPPLFRDGLKKDGAVQTVYARKNWSSVLLFNCGHPSNATLCPDTLNLAPGRALHGFEWLKDDEIGALDPAWNYLVNVNPPMADPKIVHFTEGAPFLAGHDQDPFADEWFSLARIAGYRFERPVDRAPVRVEHSGLAGV